LVGDGQGTSILLKNRRDQDPANFV